MQQINTVLLSYGVSGKVFHAPFLQMHPGYRLAGAWERSQQRIGLDYAGLRSYASLQEILNDPAIELMIVNTPTHTHYDYARAALEAGKNVVVEKAFTITVAEAMELDAIAKEKRLVLSVFHNRRWDSDFSTVRDVVRGAMLGTVHTAEFSFHRYRPLIGAKAHFENPGPGAGLLNDLGPHLIDQALSLFGMPRAVSAVLRSLRSNTQVDDAFDIQLNYPQLLVTLSAGTLVHQSGPAYVLYGREASFIQERNDRQEAKLKAGLRPDSPEWNKEPALQSGVLFSQRDGVMHRESIPNSRVSYLDYYEALFAALTAGAETPVSAADGIRVMQIIEAARQSDATNARVLVHELAL